MTVGLTAMLHRMDNSKSARHLADFVDEITRSTAAWEVFFDSVGDLCACAAAARTNADSGREHVVLRDLIAPFGDLRNLARRLRQVEFAGCAVTWQRPPRPDRQRRRFVVRGQRPHPLAAEPALPAAVESWHSNSLFHSEFLATTAFAQRLGQLLLAAAETAYATLPISHVIPALVSPLTLHQYRIVYDTSRRAAGFVTWAWIDWSRPDLKRFGTLLKRPQLSIWNDGQSLLVCDCAASDAVSTAQLCALIDSLGDASSHVASRGGRRTSGMGTDQRLLTGGSETDRESIPYERRDPANGASTVIAVQNARQTRKPDATSFLTDDCLAVCVPMAAVRDAEIVWLNKREMAADPLFDHVGKDEDRYRRELVSRCAFILRNSSLADRCCPVTGHESKGFVDRYGGDGIGRNGGSGRSAYVNGYYVKGVGRTPLIHPSTDEAHASGGAYLEECVRETIFSEICHSEFPAGSVPVLAIIDIGADVVWNERAGPRAERHTLLVRPPFVRPAHGELAYNFGADNSDAVGRDVRRVRRFYELLGDDHVRYIIEEFGRAWGQQAAYGFAHRLPHCGYVTSNIALDGALLDFGATSAVPSWGTIRLRQGHADFGREMYLVLEAISALCESVRHFAHENGAGDGLRWSAHVRALTAQSYVDSVLFETLRLCGVRRVEALAAIRGASKTELARIFDRLRRYWGRDRFTIILRGSKPSIEFDLARVWDPVPPYHLRSLRGFINSLCASGDQDFYKARADAIVTPRQSLYREDMKRSLYAALGPSPVRQTADPICIERVIKAEVEKNRRDSKLAGADDGLVTGYFFDRGLSTLTVRDALGRLRLVIEAR